MTLFLVVAYLILNVVANLCIRSGMSSFRPGVIGVLAYMAGTWRMYAALLCYGGSFVAYSLLLTRINLCIVYPFIIGLISLVLAGISALFLKERLTVSHIVGILLVMAGVVCLGA